MWAQLIRTRLRPGAGEGLPRLFEQLRVVEQPGSGLLRSTAMRDEKDPSQIYMLVVFESEEKARGERTISDAKRGCKPCGRRWRRSSTVLRSSWT